VTSVPVATSARRQSALRTALAGLIGNVLEWFDFAVYGYFASDIRSEWGQSGVRVVSDPGVRSGVATVTEIVRHDRSSLQPMPMLQHGARHEYVAGTY
jgi:hypothetical protein